MATELLSIRQLAEYLTVSEKTVHRMLDRGELPGVRVGVQWRFRRSDIDSWLARDSARGRAETGDESMDIAPLLTADNIRLDLPPQPRDELLSLLAGDDRLLRALRERET